MINDKINKYLNESKKAKFEIGDKVRIKELKRSEGKITKVLSYDSIIKEHKYKVKDDKTGNVKTWNESSLEKIK